MKRRPSHKELVSKSYDLTWSIDNDVFLIENQDMPLEEQATHLKLTVDQVSDRRSRLGLLRRAKAVMRLDEKQ
jgi:hypothetical protein